MKLRVHFATPLVAGTTTGNRVSAERWARRVEELGHEVVIAERWAGEPADVLVALHARKSYPSIAAWCAARPGAPLVVALTGTDLYGDLAHDADAQRAVELATSLVLLQPRGLEVLAPHLRPKARPIIQSSPPFEGTPIDPAPGAFSVVVLAHLRAVKDPLRAAHAARLLPPSSKIAVVHLGGTLDPALEAAAREEARTNPRWRWLGERPRAEALATMAGSKLLVLTSLQEGGANVVTEAIAAGVPVISSKIEGSLGLLGEDYPGYFPPGDTRALAALLRRAEDDSDLLDELRARGRALRAMVDPAREREAWRILLEETLGRR